MQLRHPLLMALVMIGIGFGQVACSAKKIASNTTAKIMVNGSKAMEAQEDVELARDSLIGMLRMLEVFQADNPKNDTYNLLLARAYGNYAYAFLEEDLLTWDTKKDSDEYKTALQRADLFYSKGRDNGLVILNRNTAVKKALASDVDTLKKTLARVYTSKKDVPALYWTAFNWANWLNLHKDSPSAIAGVAKVEALMARAHVLDPDYFYAGIYQFFGAFYASRPAMLGGDLKKSKESFELALKGTQEKFLLAKVAYAQYYAVAAQDKALYERLLREVVAADPKQLPEERLANEVAIIRAKTLLAKANTYF